MIATHPRRCGVRMYRVGAGPLVSSACLPSCPAPAPHVKRVVIAAAARREPCSEGPTGGGSGDDSPAGGSGGSTASDSLRADGPSISGVFSRSEQLRQLRQRLAGHAERLEHFVQQQEFGSAAAERDAVQALQLRARAMELEVALEMKEAAGVQHRLGTVIQHRRYSYRGVIVGYDPTCLAPEEWIQRAAPLAPILRNCGKQMMSVDLLPLGRHQPFYHVLVDERCRPGNQTTYVAQENIAALRVPREVRHPLVDSFFTEFSLAEGGYVPGPRLRQQYPQEF